MFIPKRQLTAWGLLALAILLAVGWNQVPLADAAYRLSKLPANAPGLAVRDVPFSAAETLILGPAHALRRRYSSVRGTMLVTVIDGSANRHALHDPVFCLRGAGWTIQSNTPTAIAHGTARRLVLGHGADSQAILAWYSDGTRAFSSPREAWLRTALRRMSFGASGMPITLVIVQFSPGLPPGPEFLDQLAGL